jgi:hypothetical protein
MAKSKVDRRVVKVYIKIKKANKTISYVKEEGV